jgi:hypothetical protein
MSSLLALAISIGVLAAVATFIGVADIGSLGLQVWAIFLAWACFFHVGGKEQGIVTTIVCMTFGVIIGLLALWGNANLNPGLDGALWAGICVGIGAFIIVLASSIPLFAAIPASVYGFAAIAAFALLKTGTDDLLNFGMGHPGVIVVLSIIAGAIFGYLSEKLAGILAKD